MVSHLGFVNFIHIYFSPYNLDILHDKYALRKDDEVIDLEKVVARGEIDMNKVYKAQVRYHGEYLDCKVKSSSGTQMQIILNPNTLVDKGQSVVIYDYDICLAGGIVK
jgi:tRNA U34 2-thiouridine synthase MnmA/TrmU